MALIKRHCNTFIKPTKGEVLHKIPAPMQGALALSAQDSGLKPRVGMPVPFRDSEQQSTQFNTLHWA